MAKRKKKVSLQEFRAWLEGVEELQPEGWSPDQKQWILIREKIESIVDNKTATVAPEPATSYSPPIPPMPPMQNGTVFQPSIPAPPMLPDMNAQQMLQDAKTKTPDIDSSGGYNSDFV